MRKLLRVLIGLLLISLLRARRLLHFGGNHHQKKFINLIAAQSVRLYAQSLDIEPLAHVRLFQTKMYRNHSRGSEVHRTTPRPSATQKAQKPHTHRAETRLLSLSLARPLIMQFHFALYCVAICAFVGFFNYFSDSKSFNEKFMRF
jgi:hypothetical protein